jgi:hypothetical protein
MESRAMLSATGVDVLASGESVLPLHFADPVARQMHVAPVEAEGGFIVTSTVAFSTDVLNYYISGSDSNRQSISITDLLNHGGAIDFDGTYAWHIPNGNGTDGFVPLVSPPPEPPIPGPSGQDQAAVDDSAEAPEGGVIALEQFLPGNRGIVNFSQTQPATLLASSQTGSRSASNITDPLTESENDDISGEWARAAVFEIAGGEPLTAESGSAGALDNGNMLESAQLEAGPSPDDQALRSSTARTEHVAPLSARAAALEHTGSVRSAAHFAASLELIPAAAALAAHDARPETGPASALGDPLSDDAATAVFDRLGAGDDVADPSTRDRWHLSSSFSAAPLLLVFALERVMPRRWGRRRPMPQLRPRRAK